MPEAVTPGGRLTESEGVREEEGLRGPPVANRAPCTSPAQPSGQTAASSHSPQGTRDLQGVRVGATRWAGRPPEGLRAEALHEAAAGRAQQDTPPPRDGPAVTDTPDRTVPPDPGVRV